MKDKELRMKDKDIQILKLENENKLLKMKTKDVEEETTLSKNVKQIEPIEAMPKKSVDDVYMSIDDLVIYGIEKFFFGKSGFSDSYDEWFDVMDSRLTKNNPFIFEKFVLVKVNCKNSKDGYYFYSCNENTFYGQRTDLKIYNKGWRHGTSIVLMLHPYLVNKSLRLIEDGDTGTSKINFWSVESIPEVHIERDSSVVILCLKK